MISELTKPEIEFENRYQNFARQPPNGLRYPRWGGRRDAVRLGKCSGVEKCLESRQNPQRRVHALLGGLFGLEIVLHD